MRAESTRKTRRLQVSAFLLHARSGKQGECAPTDDHYAEVNTGMLEESSLSRNSSYLVPCVLKAVHMIEALRETGTGLRVENLRSMTGYSRTTIYRILRTLVACGYIHSDSRGSYRLNYAVAPAVSKSSRNDERDNQLEFPPKSSGAHGVGFERWGIRFRENGARMDSAYTTKRNSASRDGDR